MINTTVFADNDTNSETKQLKKTKKQIKEERECVVRLKKIKREVDINEYKLFYVRCKL